MIGYAELEISLHRRETGSYAIDFRFSQPDSDADIRLGQDQTTQTGIDLDALLALTHSPDKYGEKLTQDFFAEPAVLAAFTQAVSSAQSQNRPLRLRLVIGPSAPELHSVRWETMNNPLDNTPLCTNENIIFSRYLSSLDWRPVRLRPRDDLSALVLVANPSNLDEYNLSAVDVPGEIERARSGLGNIRLSLIPDPDKAGQATSDQLIDQLREKEFDILYLVAHGALVKNEPWLWLEDQEGKVARTSGIELVTRLKELQKRPRLVVLASCQSAGKNAGDALQALAPRLAEAGIPAVIAMQGNISMETVADFMPAFFEELRRDGQIDRAITVARGKVRARADYWMPALFTRLKSGRIWYVPGFGEDRKGFEKWPALMRSIKRGQCTPVLGPGLYEPYLGAPREIAQRWAEAYHYPMAPHERESLPQVAQYLTINQYQRAPYDELEEYLQGEVQSRFTASLPPELRQGRMPLDQLLDVVRARVHKDHPFEPHQALAQLPLPIFITTNHDGLLTSALKDAGKDPQPVLCPWNEYIEQIESVYDREPDYFPTPERPLVYHLFGRIDEPDSLVLTEDDYFDFLIGITGNKDLIPSAVRRALADTALLFLGFQMDDWNFRVLFRSILSQQGGSRRDRYAHIAAQVEPEEGRNLEPERARSYLENYFAKGADISLFWGTPEDFVKELI
ncbi:MAG TPA: CHAT domain-containing protein, partial [Anaerolineales bacterium]|nr:CHAT domain-containing protein [Anaerolineales bacterium]